MGACKCWGKMKGNKVYWGTGEVIIKGGIASSVGWERGANGLAGNALPTLTEQYRKARA